MGIEPGDCGVRLLKMKILAEVMTRGLLIESVQEVADGKRLVLPADPSIDRIIHMFRKYGWLESYEFTQHGSWQACRGWMEELDGEMPCGVVCKGKDVRECYVESFPVHMLRSEQPFTAEFASDQDLKDWDDTVKGGYEIED